MSGDRDRRKSPGRLLDVNRLAASSPKGRSPAVASSSSSSSSSPHDIPKELEPPSKGYDANPLQTEGTVDYVAGIKTQIFNFVARRCIRENMPQFKLSDVKLAFLTISMIYLEAACAELVKEGKITIPESRQRIVVYSVNRAAAEIIVPPEEDPPQEDVYHRKYHKRVIIDDDDEEDDEGKENNTAAKQHRAPKRPKSSAQSRGGGEEEATAVSPYREDDDDDFCEEEDEYYDETGKLVKHSVMLAAAAAAGRGAEGGAGSSSSTSSSSSSSAGVAPYRDDSPKISLRLNSGSATYLESDMLVKMVSIMSEAFADNGEGMLLNEALRARMEEQIGGPVSKDDFDEFLRHMSDENKIMFEGDEIYEI